MRNHNIFRDSIGANHVQGEVEMVDIEAAVSCYIKSHGIKQAFLAERCGWSKQKVSRIVRGEQRLYARELARICDALDLPYEFFFQQAGPPDDGADRQEK